ncbi:MAG: DUF2628 domain-containing protein [Oscillospiraceae bacterium]|nr:DUF2628 domain-containing protein [Oscillospiraceae bacterium]
MRYTGVKCVLCGEVFEENSDAVVCPVCGAPHHRTCWQNSGKCAMSSAHSEGYTWIFPEEIKQARQSEEKKNEPINDNPEIKLKNGENIIPCPRCGSANYENDIYCLRCGAKLNGENSDNASNRENTFEEGGENEFFGSPFKRDGRTNGYYDSIRSDFDRFGGISPDAPVDGIPCAEYSDYVGGKKPGKIIRKISTIERYDRKLSWTWSALLLGPIWYFWRKMIKEGVIFSLILVFLASMFGVLQLNSTLVEYYKKLFAVASQAGSGVSFAEMQEELMELQEEYTEKISQSYSTGRIMLLDGVQYLMMCGLPIASALFAIPRYRKKVKDDILKIRGECSNMAEYKNALISKGGVSAAGAVLGVAAIILAALLSVYLPLGIAMFI